MKTLRSPRDLADAGLVPVSGLPELDRVARRYAVAVTPAMAALIHRDDPEDPIARQFIPTTAELEARDDERPDPIGDAAHSPVPGIVHRYPDRVLLTLLRVCPVYCRFCFRRETVGPGPAAILSADDLAAALRYIAATPAIWEVILTGGDPLALPSHKLAAVLRRIGKIGHVRVVRVHTRVPVVDPDRVTPALVEALKSSGKTTYVALHSNHPRELTASAEAACARLVDAGIAMVSQTVLLRGVNDDPGILAELMRRFVELRIRPYYLHQLDHAPGTSHFRVGLEVGRALVRALRGRLSGLCQPTYVLDIPGGYGKVPVGPTYLSDDADVSVSDPWGGTHRYPPSRLG